MSIKNKIMLITYPDSLGGNLKKLNFVLNTYFHEVIKSVHILPFYPSSADRGFAPLTYMEVDNKFGSWDDIKAIGENFDLMFDFMINHISRQSVQYQDFLENKNNSEYSDMFIRFDSIWRGFPDKKDIDLIYKRKPRSPYIEEQFADGSIERIWCTFDEEQIDLNIKSKKVKKFIKKILKFLVKNKAKIIRLDAFPYLIKKAGTNCFFVEPEIWRPLKYIKNLLNKYNIDVLPELHEHYSYQLKLAGHNFWVYDFALPMLLLYTIYSKDNKRLINWLNICPRKQFTTLDTHDGIGVVDVNELLSEDEIEETKNYLFTKGANVKKIFSSSVYKNLDIYQINCTYYSALGNDDNAYILSRAIQFFSPGIPQVYYVGLLCGENDIKLVNKTKIGRNINRHYYSEKEIKENLKRPVVKRLFNLMKFRNNYKAFEGEFLVSKSNNNDLFLSWKKSRYHTVLSVDLLQKSFLIIYYNADKKEYDFLKGV